MIDIRISRSRVFLPISLFFLLCAPLFSKSTPAKGEQPTQKLASMLEAFLKLPEEDASLKKDGKNLWHHFCRKILHGKSSEIYPYHRIIFQKEDKWEEYSIVKLKFLADILTLIAPSMSIYLFKKQTALQMNYPFYFAQLLCRQGEIGKAQKFIMPFIPKKNLHSLKIEDNLAVAEIFCTHRSEIFNFSLRAARLQIFLKRNKPENMLLHAWSFLLEAAHYENRKVIKKKADALHRARLLCAKKLILPGNADINFLFNSWVKKLNK
ncbi:hypothetical protein ACFL35_17655 [Candidatus Riflebacteria bacterium]